MFFPDSERHRNSHPGAREPLTMPVMGCSGPTMWQELWVFWAADQDPLVNPWRS